MDVIFEISASKLFKKSPNLIWGKKKIFSVTLCNPCILTLAVNPKEYLEIFDNKKLNKKYKSIKKRIIWPWF